MNEENKPKELTPVNPLVKVESSQIHSIGYNPVHKHLDIKFHGRGTSPASTYRYFGVEPEAHQELMSSKSVGSHHGKNIRGKYEYQRFPDEPKEEVKS